MAQNAFKMFKLASQGYCCSQMIVLMDLEERGIENYDLVRSMAGLCGGVGGSGNICGVVTGGACLLSSYLGKGSPEEANDLNLGGLIEDFMEWFEEKNGSLNCEDIVGFDSLKGINEEKAYPVKCGNIISDSYKKLREIIDEFEDEDMEDED